MPTSLHTEPHINKKTKESKLARNHEWFMTYFIWAFYIWIFVAAFVVLINNSSNGVTPLSAFLYIAGSSLWLLHGLIRQDTVVILAAIIGFIGNVILISAILLVNYDQPNSPKGSVTDDSPGEEVIRQYVDS